MKIVIETIPHKKQRYPTPGDWWFEKNGVWHIRVSQLSDWRYEILIAVHELVEMALCKTWCVSEVDVTNFDIQFEAERAAGKHTSQDEPGDDPRAPYRTAHFVATTIERIFAVALCVDWGKYDKEVVEL